MNRKIVEDVKWYRGIGTLIRLRCGNTEESNKYWTRKEDERRCVFCDQEKDDFEQFIREGMITKSRFDSLGSREDEKIGRRIWSDDLDKEKKKALRRFWEKEKKKGRKKWRKSGGNI